jgi:hypothetical protein
MRRRPPWRTPPGVQPQAATPGAPIVVGEPTATLAEPTAPAVVAENVPQREVKLTFATIAPPPGSIVLRGSRPDASVEFGMRSDELVANALLNLEYTPSPSLLPVQSQLKVYLNDELMGVLPSPKSSWGKRSARSCRLTRCISPTSTAYGWSLSATTAMSAKTRPAARCGWTSGAKAIWISPTSR